MTIQTLAELDLCLAIAQTTSDSNPLGWGASLTALAAIVASAYAGRWLHRLPLPGPLKPKLDKLQAVRVDPANLPSDVAAFFQTYHTAISDLGFSSVGDFLTKSGKEPCYVRHYCRSDLDVSAQIVVARSKLFRFINMPSMRMVEFTSILEDGTYLYSTSLRIPEEHRLRPPQIVYRSRPRLNTAQLLEEHCRCVDEYAAQNNTYTLHYPAEQIVDVSLYYMQYQRDYWVSKGIVDSPPGYDADPTTIHQQSPVGLNA